MLFPLVEPAARRERPGGPSLLTPTQKADVLIEALGWIRQFRGKITVIKLGGSVMDDANALRHLLLDVVFMETVGMRPVIVHGGGAAISRAMDAAGLEPRFIQGRRYTDEATLDIVEQVLAYRNQRASGRSGSKSSAAAPRRSIFAPPTSSGASGSTCTTTPASRSTWDTSATSPASTGARSTISASPASCR